MIDLNFVCSDQWDSYCKKLEDECAGPGCWHIKNTQLTIPNIEDAIEQNFFSTVSGYDKPKNDYIENTLLDTLYYDQSEFNDQIKKILNLKFCNVILQIQQPGKIITPHVDRARNFLIKILDDDARARYNYTDLRRFLYFPNDQELGQFFQFGKEYLRWKSGDLFEFSFYVPHATANASTSPRPMLVITGI